MLRPAVARPTCRKVLAPNFNLNANALGGPGTTDVVLGRTVGGTDGASWNKNEWSRQIACGRHLKMKTWIGILQNYLASPLRSMS